MSQVYERAIAVLLAHEGDFTDHPSDPGGETNFGISLRFLKGVGLDVDGDGVIGPDDIRKLSRADAVSLYRREWWDRHGYDRLPDDIAIKVFDLAVNMGARQAHKLLQRACHACGSAISEDGVLGPVTIAAARTIAADALLPALRSEAAGFYRALVAARPDLNPFLNGWIRRAYS